MYRRTPPKLVTTAKASFSLLTLTLCYLSICRKLCRSTGVKKVEDTTKPWAIFARVAIYKEDWLHLVRESNIWDKLGFFAWTTSVRRSTSRIRFISLAIFFLIMLTLAQNRHNTKRQHLIGQINYIYMYTYTYTKSLSRAFPLRSRFLSHITLSGLLAPEIHGGLKLIKLYN